MEPKELTLLVEETAQLTATVTPSNATNKKINWSSSDEEVATVDASGNVTAVAVGTATITATSDADSSKKDSCIVKVIVPQDIQIEGNGFVNSTSYRGVFVEISTPGSANDKIKSFKVELFNADNELIGTNTLKSELLKANGGNLPDSGLTSPFVVIPEEDGYSSKSWTTTWEEGEPNFYNAPAYALITAIDNNGVAYTAEETYTGDWRSVWAQDITVTSANDSGIVDSDSYKGVTATFTLGGTDIAKVESIKVELFDAEDNLLATNALKSHKFPLGAGNLTAPIVAIEGTYAYGSWEKTVWTDGNPDPLTPPSYVVMTLTDKNGVTYSAEERNLHTVHSGGGDWASLWGVKVVGTEGELRDALVNTDVERIILGNDISLTDHLDIRRSVVLDGKGNTITAVFNKVDGALIHLRNADNVTIKNVTITTAEDKRMMGIDNTGSIDGLIIERVTFKDMELGFYSNGEINGKIEDCIFENLNKGIGYSHSPSFHLLFKDNIFRNIKSMYFEIFGEPSDEVVNAIIENNVFLYKDIEVAVIVDDEGNIVATEVYVTTEEELIAALANTDVKGIILGDNMNLTAQLRLSRPLVLDGNGKTITVEKAEENQAILLTSDDIEIRSFTVVGSTMNWGIVLVAGIEGVVIDDVTVTGMGGGIYANPDSQGEIKNCTFDTLGTGIGYDRSDFEITGNSFEDITSMYLEIFGNHTEEEIAEILLNNAFDYPVKVVIEENGLKRYTIIAQ